MKYFGGCDVGSTYAKCVILDENGKMVADATVRSKINPVQSAELALGEAIGKVDDINSAEDLSYLIGTGYGRNKVPFADENISEISCHAMGVHVTNPAVKAIIDIGGQDVKGIAIDTDGTVKNFAMNDKCAAGTGRFFEAMANAFEMSLPDFCKLSLQAKNTIPITAQCTVFAESEVISLVGEGYQNVVDELWRICEEFNADTVIMYDQISCKGMDGLNGIFDDQARERNINFIWVAQDLMDPRTISRRDMREQINKYMTTVLQEEPVDPTLVDFDDTLAW